MSAVADTVRSARRSHGREGARGWKVGLSAVLTAIGAFYALRPEGEVFGTMTLWAAGGACLLLGPAIYLYRKVRRHAAEAVFLRLERDGEAIECERKAELLRRAQETHREQTALLETVLENISEGIVVLNEQGRVVLWNEAACELPGVLSPSPRGGPGRRVLSLSPAIDGAPAGGWWRLAGDLDLHLRDAGHPEGVRVRVSTRPLRDDRKNAKGAIAVFRRLDAVDAAPPGPHAPDRSREVAEASGADPPIRAHGPAERGAPPDPFRSPASSLLPPLDTIIALVRVLMTANGQMPSDRQKAYLMDILQDSAALRSQVDAFLKSAGDLPPPGHGLKEAPT